MDHETGQTGRFSAHYAGFCAVGQGAQRQQHAHAEGAVDLLGMLVFALHIQTYAADIRLRPCQVHQMAVQVGEHPLPAGARVHIDALDPPDRRVAPVTPFIGNHYLADNCFIELGNPIASLGFVA